MTNNPNQHQPDGDGLLPCPLCGSSEIARGICYVEGSKEKERAVRCVSCGCRATLSAWNTRATPPVRGDREQLREAIACAYALTQWHEKLENLEGSMQDGCRGFANRVVAALPVQSGEVITKEAAEAATKRAT